jgi:uncharacterized small protein (DUF1192 family)
MRRALHFATREIGETPRIVPLPATWLAFYLLYRAGMPVDEIAALVDVHRKHIARRLLASMALLGRPEIRDRIEALAAEMGRITFEDREAERLAFPGPSRLSQRITEVAS